MMPVRADRSINSSTLLNLRRRLCVEPCWKRMTKAVYFEIRLCILTYSKKARIKLAYMPAMDCTTTASCFFTVALAGIDDMQALHHLRLMLLHHYPGWPRLHANTALHHLRLMLLHHYPGWPRLHANTALHYLCLMLTHHYPVWPRLHANTALHCTALHYLCLMLLHHYPVWPRLHANTALHCTALHYLCLMLLHHYPVWPRLHANTALHCTALPPPHASSPLSWLA